MGTGYSPSRPTPVPHHPGYTPLPGSPARRHGLGGVGELNSVVGLISVEQLSLGHHFSVFWGMTEVYNLLRIGRISNHLSIPGTD